ncbi:ACP phosphodiesterase [Dyadobacter sp. CY345]|uniref:acyl carrier protein phosphodiesterase n=1 Tax=Dyadobacter sp. CY345 TaxID=2909335 RepID=UPI001F3CCCCA|nr:ACP phosphodiesterase [Dyadobacter sp. CY345]MCF2446491.1 ACP phosphodiesterase [Dyadobacter sp. CY345]
MNFLAHLLLSGDNEEVIIGNYVGDFIKGRLTGDKIIGWSNDFLLGVKLHRHIDMFTDEHPIVREAKHKAAEELGRTAGIAIDIYFDYFLAKYFDQFCNETLAAYSARMYDVIRKNDPLIPDHMKSMVRTMIKQDWLNTYETLEGIKLTFKRLSGRAEFLEVLNLADKDLKRNEEFYHNKFDLFFPLLQAESARFIVETRD